MQNNLQEYLIREQNELLKKQNELLAQLLDERKMICSDDREVFVENIDKDEMRSGFLVTSQRKKLWNVQINLINEVARICDKHNIRWFAIGGTLLGAVRHKGFIPWDDDVDILMFRPDYAKFQEVAVKEIRDPYFLDIWYNYRLESEGASLTDPEGDFQFITAEQEKMRPHDWFTQWPSIRLRDSRTMMIEMPDRNFINQGIFIDVFPFDPVPPFTDQNQWITFNRARVLMTAVANPALIKRLMQDKKNLLIDYGELEKFLKLPYKRRGEIYEDFMLRNFYTSERMGKMSDYTLVHVNISYSAKDLAEVVYLPFEKIEVPAPVGYESCLKDEYGENWRTPIFTHSHAQIYSADISCKEYFNGK